MENPAHAIVIGNARFTVFTPGCVRLEYAKDGNFSPYPSLLTADPLPEAIPAESSQHDNQLTIRTDRFELAYTDTGENFSAANLRITHKNQNGGRETWTPGKCDRGNLGTVVRSLDFWKWCGGPQRFPVEGLLSTEGGHFLPDEPRIYWNKQHDWPENRSGTVWFDGYFFAYGNDYKSALRDFVRVFGPIPMVPRWTFGFWYSRWYAYKDHEFIALAKEYRQHGIPIDVMIIDTDWRANWGGYDWTTSCFPDPAKTMAELHELGLHTSLNDHPGYDNYDALPADDSHIPAIEKALGPLPHAGQWACDWSNKKAVKTWRDKLLGPFFDQGMDFWWIDGWIKSPFGSLDSQLWANRQYYELREEKTKNRGLVLSRWGGIGSHRYPVQFSGDTPPEWHMLRHQIEFTAWSGNLGAAYWSHDIGGFFNTEVDEELFIRWFQFGSLSPVFRTHSDHGIREPWKISERALELFRKQTRIRYALAPSWYTLAREANVSGLPIIRPLYLEYNDNDGGALNRKHQYLIGRDLLVIPADAPGDKQTRRLKKRAYFPNGTWIALESDDIKSGLFDGDIEIPIEHIPVYVRQGAIIPAQPVTDSIGTAPPGEIHFDYYPDPIHPSSFTLYEDDGETNDYKKGRFATIQIEAKRKENRLELAVSAPDGNYRGRPAGRTYVLRFRLEPDEQVRSAIVSVGRAKAQETAVRISSECLAGTVQSAWRFGEVRISSPNAPVRLEVELGS